MDYNNGAAGAGNSGGGGGSSGSDVSRPMPLNLADMAVQLQRMSQLAIDVENLKMRNTMLEAELYRARHVRLSSASMHAPLRSCLACAIAWCSCRAAGRLFTSSRETVHRLDDLTTYACTTCCICGPIGAHRRRAAAPLLTFILRAADGSPSGRSARSSRGA